MKFADINISIMETFIQPASTRKLGPASWLRHDGAICRRVQELTAQILDRHGPSQLQLIKPIINQVASATRLPVSTASKCTEAAKKAMKILGIIRRQFKNMDKEAFMILYKSFVRPHMEYAIQAWSPHFRKDIDCLEKVQQRASRPVSYTHLTLPTNREV